MQSIISALTNPGKAIGNNVYWPGRWVKFFPKIEGHLAGAFHARDGRCVGIYCEGNIDHPETPYIAVVNEDGDNLMLNIQGTWLQAKIMVQQNFLEPITDRRDIPPKRLLHVSPDWQPRK